MKPSETIIVHLDSVEQLLEPCPPSPFRQRRLREEAEQFLVERVTALPRKAPVKLLIALHETERGKEQPPGSATQLQDLKRSCFTVTTRLHDFGVASKRG